MERPLSRREFIRAASAFAAVLSWHAPGRLRAQMNAPVPPGNGPHRFAALRLRAADPGALRRFYGEVLGLPLVQEPLGADGAVRVGSTRLEFVTSREDDAPFYHFAFNIPNNKFAQAKAWLAQRTPLLKDSVSGADEIAFQAWNAHAVYFKDPAGNIGELIARHTLKNAREGGFGPDDLLCVSEIGLPTEDPESVGAALEAGFGLKRYLGSPMFMGDEQGLFILPKVGRPWIPERTQNAAIHAVDAIIRTAPRPELRIRDLPYIVRSEHGV